MKASTFFILFPTGQFFKMEEGANRSPSLPTCDEKEKETFHRLQTPLQINLTAKSTERL